MKKIYLFIFIALFLFSCSDDNIYNPPESFWQSVLSKNYNDTVKGIYLIGATKPLYLDSIDLRNSDSVKCRITANAKNISQPMGIFVGGSSGALLNIYLQNNFPPIDSNNLVIFEQVNHSPKIKDLFVLSYFDTTNAAFLIIKKVEINKK